ncbi:FecCD family ABC transporter permease [Aliikangiella coralliicola]|uniref:FecCD family ABC transporter permease n=1 Tax=Aliikangiella coralliicola TaxID=2592383 RepID=UPI00143CC98F|nr:iron ABC transporter permease [Aliikangiella coralliicola]
MELTRFQQHYCFRFAHYSVLIHPKQILVALFLFILLAAACLIAIVNGSAKMSAFTAIEVLTGGGDAMSKMLVEQIRLPRITAALIAGFALGLSGCLIQTTIKNRLATPEIIGVNDGATAAVVLVSALSMSGTWAWWIGPIGAVCAFIFLALLAGQPGREGYRLIVIGMALAELLRSGSDLTLSMQEMHLVNGLYVWKNGSLSGQGYEVSLPVLAGIGICVPLLITLSRRLKAMQLSDDTVKTLGVSLGFTQVLILFLAVITAGLACGITGPIAFVAMAAPIFASYLTIPNSVPVWLSGLVGALLVLLADTIARSVSISQQEIGVGIITSLIGGPFMLWVLLRDSAEDK